MRALGRCEFLPETLSLHLCPSVAANSYRIRFVNVPIGTVNKRLTRESSEATSEITNLEKKLHYHETTHKNSRDNLEQILKSGGRA